VEEYAYGRCTVFALALHNLYRYQIELLWGQPKNLGSATMPAIHSGLQHAFCIRKDGSLVDARGSVDREQIITEYGEGQEPRWQRVSKAELLSLANQGNASRPDNGELFILRCYILQNQDVYKMGTRSIEPLRDVRDQFDVSLSPPGSTTITRRLFSRSPKPYGRRLQESPLNAKAHTRTETKLLAARMSWILCERLPQMH